MGDWSGPVELLERDEARAQIIGFLTKPWPASLVVHGPPGIGKSSIVAEARARASGLGAEVWSARAAEAERMIAFSALDVVLRSTGDLDLEQPAGFPALAAAVGSRIPTKAVDVRSVGLELSGLLARRSSRAPLLLVIDDAQWVDPTSAQALSFALRRLELSPVALLLATRPGGLVRGLDLAGALSGAGGLDRRPRQCAIGPLTVGATGRMVRERLGVRLGHGSIVRVHDGSGGNPLIALELARILIDEEPLTTWERGDLMRRRIASLDEGARMLVAIVGLVGEPALALVEEVLADRGLSAIAALSTAVQADVVVLRADRLRASHPLLASAAVDLLPDQHRRRLHAAIAAHSESVELVAVHTALSCQGPEPQAAARLAQAAEGCAIRGASVRAAELAGLAVEFTPTGDEAALSRRLLQARLLLRAGEPGAAGDALEAAERLAHTPQEHIEVLLGRRDLEMAGDDRAAAHQAALAALDLAGEDVGLLARCHAAIAGCTPLGVDDEVAHARAVLDLIDETSDPSSVLSAIQTIVMCQVAAGDGIDPALIARLDALRGRAIEHTIDRPEATMEMVARTGGDLATARRMGQVLLDRARADGDETARPYLLLQAASTELREGDAVAALHLLDEADELSDAFGLDYPAAAAYRAQALALAGDATAAGDLARQGRARAIKRDSPWDALLHNRALGLVALTEGDLGTCAALLSALRVEAADLGVVEPAFLATDLDLIDALAGLGDVERLRVVVADVESAAARGHLAWTRMAAARGQVLLAGTDSLDVLGEAIGRCDDAVAGITSRYEQARADLALGRLLQRRGRRGEARARLERARAVFDGLGAAGLAAICAREGARLGGRVPSGADLTASEQQVADLAGRGLSNREIAGQLVISPRTVESHLSSAYRKLQVPGRKALIRLLAQRQP